MSKPKVNAGFRQKFIEALRSGRYKQIEGSLAYEGAYCALGVGCSVLGVKDSEMNVGMPARIADHVKKRVGIACSGITSLDYIAGLNDTAGYDFNQIADWLEKETEATL